MRTKGNPPDSPAWARTFSGGGGGVKSTTTVTARVGRDSTRAGVTEVTRYQ